jgi:hypothetical protein
MCGRQGSSNQNSHEPPTHLSLHLIHCCATKTSSFRSSTCIYDRESRSPKPSSSTILHRERANKVFRKRSSRLLVRFFKFFITARLYICRTRVEGHRLQCELHQADRCVHPIFVIKEPQVTYGSCSQIMSYTFNMLIFIGMISIDNLLQCLLLIIMIGLSKTCDIFATLICNALIMFVIYSWIKIKLKVLIYPTIQKTLL